MLITRHYRHQPRRWQLAGVDVVVNIIAEPDLNPMTLRTTEVITGGLSNVVNRPEAVRGSARDRMSGLLRTLEGVRAPGTVRLVAPSRRRALAAIERFGLSYPLLLRAAGRHGGAETAGAAQRADVRAGRVSRRSRRRGRPGAARAGARR
jgi:hypothetical protein